MRKLPDESIIICMLHHDWSARRDIGSLVRELYDLLQRVKYPIYLILDLGETTFQTDDVLLIASSMTRRYHSILTHMNLRVLILSSADPMISELATELLIHAVAFAMVLTYPSLEESLRTARHLMRTTRNEREASV